MNKYPAFIVFFLTFAYCSSTLVWAQSSPKKPRRSLSQLEFDSGVSVGPPPAPAGKVSPEDYEEPIFRERIMKGKTVGQKAEPSDGRPAKPAIKRTPPQEPVKVLNTEELLERAPEPQVETPETGDQPAEPQ